VSSADLLPVWPSTNDPAARARFLSPSLWTAPVEGLVAEPANYLLEDFIKPFTLEECGPFPNCSS